MIKYLLPFWLLLVSVANGQLPAPPAPLGQPVTPLQASLGRKLFFDKRLSQNGTVACATCHDPNPGWADPNRRAIGINGRVGTRNSPTILNAAYSRLMFHDGRTIGMPTQSLQPITNVLEMGNQTENQVLRRLYAIDGYRALFEAAYAGTEIRPFLTDNVATSTGFRGRVLASAPTGKINRDAYGHALSAFQSTIIDFGAPIHRRMRGDVNTLSPEAEKGYGLFLAANCMSCHQPPLFTDLKFHNNGMEFAGKNQITDNGRSSILQQRDRTQADIRAFKTAPLVGVGRTAPYNHAGSFDTLERVVEHYNAGGGKIDQAGRAVKDSNIDPRVRPLGLNDAQVRNFVTFLREAFDSPEYPYVTEPALP